jgi:magnesium transporter
MSALPRLQPVQIPAESGTSRCLVLNEDGTRSEVLDFSTIPALIAEPGKVVWYDLLKPSPAELEFVGETFNVHPMALDDARTRHERPKLEVYDEASALTVHNVLFEHDGTLRIDEITALFGNDYLVTIRSNPGLPTDEIEHRWYTEREDLPAKSASLLYIMLDVIADNYIHIADAFDESIYRFERSVFSDSDPQGSLRVVLNLKRQLQRFRRSVVPLREILVRFARGDSGGQVPRDLIVYYRDVLDHTQRVVDQIDSARLQLRGALDVHFSWQTQRQNDVLKQLTIVATIFLPLSYFSGFFGQNFEWMVDNIKSEASFFVFAILLQVAFVVVLFWWMKSKKFV